MKLNFKNQNPLRERQQIHALRRLVHLVAGLMVIWISTMVPSHQDFVTGLALFSLVILLGDLLRVRWGSFNSVVSYCTQTIMREGEQRKLSGMPYYWWGVTLSFLFFPYPVAYLAVLFLAVGDPAAALVGTAWRRYFRPIEILDEKSLQGSLGAIISCGIASFWLGPVVFPFLEADVVQRLHLGVVCGLFAGVGEILPLRTDDNLSLPLVSGALLWIYLASLGWVIF